MAITVYPLKLSKLFFKNYCYLVVDEKTSDALIIDPAWQFRKIAEKVQELSCQPKAVLLTHHHVDHVNLASRCAEYYQIPVLMSETEINYYQFSCKHLQPLPPYSFQSGSIPVNAILTPGHTKGSSCYHIASALFTGDTLFNEGCGICVGRGASPQEMFESLRHLRETLTDTTLIYPGHVYGTTVGKSFAFLKAENLYLQFTEEAMFVNFRMRKHQNYLSWFNFG